MPQSPLPYPVGKINAWAVTSLQKFLECPLRIYFEKVERIESPRSPAADRGVAIHLEAEQFMKGEVAELPASLSKLFEAFEELKEEKARIEATGGAVYPEGEWAFTQEWSRTGWWDDDVWARFKLDYVSVLGPYARIIDYKTGKRYGVKHIMQLIYYSLAMFLSNEEIMTVDAELWYLDEPRNNILRKQFTRGQAMQFYPTMMHNALDMTKERMFEPKPSKGTCRFCPYKEQQCRYAVT